LVVQAMLASLPLSTESFTRPANAIDGMASNNNPPSNTLLRYRLILRSARVAVHRPE
jgi:hypothetical protein